MKNSQIDFIELNRTFHELGIDTGAEFDARMVRSFGQREALHWVDLLREFRVVLLSEAGSGKTEEIRNVTRRLRNEGKHAFFIRIENVTRDFESSFEEGTFKEFSDWISSREEGWILLDSVDEARLREPGDFELAIRQIGRRISSVQQLAHIVITSRATAWRSKTDLDLCRAMLPFQLVDIAIDDDPIKSDRESSTSKKANEYIRPTAPFRIVALDDIQDETFDTFVQAKGIHDVRAFRDAVERKDAWSMTTRPQDLSELVHFWLERGQIGSRLELYESSIGRRLLERDQKRSHAQPISKDRLYLGAQLLAAATTLGRQQNIRVPDGENNSQGISAVDVLTDWNDNDISALLNRPIFDESIYGTVRFHHGEVRELLTAKWFHNLLKKQASRSQVEGLIFKFQYGVEVIIPTLRSVLPWLILFDDKILERVCRIAPEIVFEGGDPESLRTETRRKILRLICEQISQPAHGRSMMDYQALQRFANEDLAEDIKALLFQYREDEDITWFLARMVWHGQIKELASEMKMLALDVKCEKHARKAAIRALSEVGSDADIEDVRQCLLAQEIPISREWLLELVPSLPFTEASVDWLIDALVHSEAKVSYHFDSLSDVLSETAAKWPVALLPRWISGLHQLITMPPVIERHFCEVSKQNSWLAPLALQAILRLISEKNSAALEEPALAILTIAPILEQYHDIDAAETKHALQKAIPNWLELNHTLFWYKISAVREAQLKENGRRVTDFWQAYAFASFWKFEVDSFEVICADMKSKILEDDRLVALSLAFNLYTANKRPAAWRKALKEIAQKDEILNSELNKLLHPSKAEHKKFHMQELRWKKQHELRKEKDEEHKRKCKDFIVKHLDSELTPENSATLTNAQFYLYEITRKNQGNSGKLSSGNWQSLIPEFGDSVAQAYRKGAMRFWRQSCPKLQSEGKDDNKILCSAMFGLEGLEIESREVINWAEKLSDQEARTAARLAIHELNGFPSWMMTLFSAHPKAVVDLVMQEVDFELANDDPSKDSHYILDDLSWSGKWLWNDLAPLLIERLQRPPKNLRALCNLLTVVQGSSVPDKDLGRLARKKSRATTDVKRAAQWYATWTGVEPDVAIPAVAARLAEIRSDDDRTELAMRYIAALFGNRRFSSNVRQAFRTVPHMKALMLMTHQYVREREDIQRAGKGVYSPGLRDDAQDARNSLFTFIRDTPGKEAFLALSEIAQYHPNEASRPWMEFNAKEKAIKDADISPWQPGRVKEFHDHAERTPSTHRELWELAVSRLIDLKCDLEDGDNSNAAVLIKASEETEIRNYVGGWCRDRAASRYSVAQEDELADAKRPDLRFSVSAIDGPVPLELKIADNWAGPKLHERLDQQLCGDYLRDTRSGRGIFLLVYCGKQSRWALPGGGWASSFDALVDALQSHWVAIAPRFPHIDEIKVIGIDLTKRRAKASAAAMK